MYEPLSLEETFFNFQIRLYSGCISIIITIKLNQKLNIINMLSPLENPGVNFTSNIKVNTDFVYHNLLQRKSLHGNFM